MMDRFDWLELDEAQRIKRAASIDGPAEAPKDAASFYYAARRMRHAGHFHAASDYYSKTVALDGHNYTAWLELIDTLVRGKQLQQARQVAGNVCDTYRLVRPLYAAHALVLGHLAEFDEAMRQSDISLDDSSGGWYALCVRGEIMLRMNRNFRQDAQQCFEDAANCAEEMWEPRLLAGWALLDAKLPALAAGFLAESAHQNPRAPICWLCLGDSFRELRLYEQALFYYQRVTELEPTHELAVARQREAVPRIYGLLSIFSRGSLERRWKREIERDLGIQE